MTNKQVTKEQDDDLPLSREEFLEEYTRLEQAVKVIQDINRRSQEQYTVMGVDPRTHKSYSERHSIAELYSSYEPTVYQKARERFIDTISNRDSSFRTLSNLISSGTITSDELKFFPQEKLPRREITSIRRIKTNEGEYILRNETWYGITASGGIVHKDVLLGHYTEPHYETKMVPREEGVEGSPTVRVAILSSPMDEYRGKTTFIDEYTPEKIRKYLKHMKKEIPRGAKHLPLTLKKEGEKTAYTCPDIERFISEPFDQLYADLTRVRPQVDLDELSKKFAETLRKESAKEAEAAEHFQ